MNVLVWLLEDIAGILVKNVLKNLSLGIDDRQKLINVDFLSSCVENSLNTVSFRILQVS